MRATTRRSGRATCWPGSTTARRGAKLAELQARVAFLSQELQRLYSLHERRVISEKAYQQTISDHAAAVAAVAAAEQRLKDFSLVAPLDGTVLRQDGNIGEVVAAGEVIFWVGRAKPLRVTAEVDEEDIVQVRAGPARLGQGGRLPAPAVPRPASPRSPPRAIRSTRSIGCASASARRDPSQDRHDRRGQYRDKAQEECAADPDRRAGRRCCLDRSEGAAPAGARVTVGMRAAREQAEILNGLDDKAWIIVRPPKDLKDGQAGRRGPASRTLTGRLQPCASPSPSPPSTWSRASGRPSSPSAALPWGVGFAVAMAGMMQGFQEGLRPPGRRQLAPHHHLRRIPHPAAPTGAAGLPRRAGPAAQRQAAGRGAGHQTRRAHRQSAVA